jgi:hypothetical protein
MSSIKKFGLVAIVILWLGLSWLVIDLGGFNLKNLIVVAMSGVIVFTPLYKKYGKPKQ